ncbi:sterol desaturase family protein [Undibacterium sp. CY18W]|uniref:Sterol desaturase family protein n=1 Tax=Undibacterium hunanense TaxID=2762292 RepID=A0ABR6ZYJ8_9BURK|nr:sterol desaturase family protein [Undibacterium hunanense]MBC3920708.1 sterol desaturase family protein [Undibacterium hunanense]
MHEKIITFASPVFFLLIAIEFLVARKRQKHLYRINDAISSLSLGVMSQITGVFLKLLSVGAYAWVFNHFSMLTLDPGSIWVWISCLLLYDFLYYWLHRMGHETNLLWAAHVVHHQSESYNLTTALRQTSTGQLFGWVFYLPLAIIGFPVQVFVAIALIDLLYQFWVHTEQIGKLGWFDRVFVSPSNHRVHHAVNDIYLDKNYGGILVIWDRLFGSFIEEQDGEPVVYGTRSPLRSWNPLWANLEVYKAVWQDAWHTRNWADKFLIWLRPPGWRPADVRHLSQAQQFDLARPLYDPFVSKAAIGYCLLQFVALLQAATYFLLAYKSMSALNAVVYATWLIFSLWCIGGLIEKGRVYLIPESLRLLAILLMTILSANWFYSYALSVTGQTLIAAGCVISIVALCFIFLPKNTHGHLPH